MNTIDLCFSDAMLSLPSNPYLSKEWPNYVVGPDLERHADARACVSGVYFLFDADGSVVYVGQSEYVGLRIQQHRGSKREFVAFAWVEVPSGLLAAVEAAYIHALNPPQNRSIPDPVYMQHDMMVKTIRDRWAARSALAEPPRRRESKIIAEELWGK